MRRAIVGGSATPGLHERLERLLDRERPDTHRADLAHPVARRREPGRLEVEDDELGVLDQRLALAAVRETYASATPLEARVAVDDVGEERVRERRGRALEREESACRLFRRHRAASRVDQLDEAVGGVERELHRDPPYTNICSYTRAQPDPALAAKAIQDCGGELNAAASVSDSRDPNPR